MSVTISDVARLAGVGRGTVSRVLNDRSNVDPATRARVLAAIKELDFVPSQTARRLSLGRTQTVAVILPFLTRPSAVERLRGIELTLAAGGYDLIVFNVETRERRDAVFRDLPRPERVDGIIIVSLSPHPEEIERIARVGLPAVLVDAHHRSMPRIVADDVLGGRLAAEHLIGLGHERIAFIGDIPRTPLAFTSSRLRLTGVRRALLRAGLRLPASRVAIGDHSRRRAAELAQRMLLRPARPTAIICASDTQAAGALQAAEMLGLQVPGDLSVTGYDDLDLADHLGLTTIRQPLFESGVRAVQRVMSLIDGQPAPTLREVQDISLVVRRSTAPPRPEARPERARLAS
ncbi:MAG TPA: LacI family DNA-binding transcriptional regulator [Candidatus Limnocylindrales bacterium]